MVRPNRVQIIKYGPPPPELPVFGKVKPEEVDASKQNLAYAYFFIAFQDKDTDKEKAKQYIAKSLQYDGSNQDALNLSKTLMN